MSENPKKKSLSAQSNEFFNAARQFDEAETNRIRKNAKIAWRLVGMMSVITCLSIAAVVMLTPLKTVQPFVIRVDNNTGLTDTVSVMNNDKTVTMKLWINTF